MQESGALGVAITKVGANWEVTCTEFLTDVSMRIIRINSIPPVVPCSCEFRYSHAAGMRKNLSDKRGDVGLDSEQRLTVDFEIYLPFGDCVVTRNMHIAP